MDDKLLKKIQNDIKSTKNPVVINNNDNLRETKIILVKIKILIKKIDLLMKYQIQKMMIMKKKKMMVIMN